MILHSTSAATKLRRRGASVVLAASAEALEDAPVEAVVVGPVSGYETILSVATGDAEALGFSVWGLEAEGFESLRMIVKPIAGGRLELRRAFPVRLPVAARR